MVIQQNVRNTVLAALTIGALSLAAPALAAAETREPVYTIAGNTASPYIFTGASGAPEGLIIDLLNAVERISGLRFRYRVAAWKEIQAAVDLGEGIDIVAGLVPTPERHRSFDFTAPFAIFPFATFVRRDAGIAGQEDLAGKSVAVLSRSLSLSYVRDAWPHVRVVGTDGVEDALRGVAEARYDAAVLPRLMAVRILDKEGISAVAPLKQDVFVSSLAFAVVKGRGDLVKRLDDALAGLKADGTYDAIHYRWSQEPGRDQISYEYRPFLLALFGGLLLLLGAGGVWSWSLQRQVTRKTRELAAGAEQTKLLEDMINRSPVVACVVRAEEGLPCDYVSHNAARLEIDRQAIIDGVRSLCDFVDPADIARVMATIEKHAAEGPDDFVMEFHFVGRNGSRPVESIVHIQRDASGKASRIECLASDITERRRAERTLRENMERVRASFDLGPDGIIMVRASDSRIVDANPGFEALSGWARADTVGRTVPELGLWAEPGAWTALEGYLRNDGAARNHEVALRTRVKATRTGLLHAALASIDNEPHYLIIIRDITELRHARDELRRAHDELELRVSERTRALEREVLERQYAEKALQEANEFLEHRVTQRTRELETEVAERRRAERDAANANQAKTEFLANVSHELRTPLNSIIGFSDILAAQLFGPIGHGNYLEYARDINEAGKHLLAIINDILDVSRLEIGTTSLEETRLDVRHVLRSCRRLAEGRRDGKGIHLATHADPSLPALRADERRVKQILLNLLSNALKFTPAGGRVTLSARLGSDGGFIFEVSDTGIGIAPEKMKLVMSAFGQADGSLSRRFDGVGLGLPLSARLARIHGGSLTLASEPGMGTTVRVHFPPERSIWIEAEAGVVA